VGSVFGSVANLPPFVEGLRPPKTVTYQVECRVEDCSGSSTWHLGEGGLVEGFYPVGMNYRVSSWSATLPWYASPHLGVYPSGRNTCRIFINGILKKKYSC
jgi:hypothetical protein